MALLRVRVLGEAEHLHERRAHRVVDDPAQRAKLLEVVELGRVHDRAVVFEAPRHAARAHLESGGVGDDGLLEADLRPVREGGHHRRVLSPPLGPALLRGRVAIGILQPLHVHHRARDEPEALHPAEEVHLHAGLVAFAGGEDLAVLARVEAEDRTEGRVHLGVHEDDRLLVGERLEDDLGAELHRARHVDDDVHLGRAADGEGILGDDGRALADGLVESGLGLRHHHVVATRVLVDADRALGLAIVDGRHAHAAHAVDDLVGEPLAHEPGADHADADRLALRFVGGERPVDDDHVSPPMLRPAGYARRGQSPLLRRNR